MEPLQKSILDFWFGPLDSSGLAAPDKVQRWFQKDAEFDKLITRHYKEYLDPALFGAFDRWGQEELGQVALIVLLDQFPRNIFRGKAKAFYFDGKALHLAMQGISAETYLKLPATYAYFSLLPCMHAESIEIQNQGVECFEKLLEKSQLKLIAEGLRYMKLHRDIIERFGRFPHRNETLNRESSTEEIEFLKQPGSSF